MAHLGFLSSFSSLLLLFVITSFTIVFLLAARSMPGAASLGGMPSPRHHAAIALKSPLEMKQGHSLLGIVIL